MRNFERFRLGGGTNSTQLSDELVLILLRVLFLQMLLQKRLLQIVKIFSLQLLPSFQKLLG